MKSLTHFSIPKNLSQILKEEGYWEDDNYEPLFLSAEEVIFKGKKTPSFQISFPKLEEYDGINGCAWEAIITRYVQAIKADLASNIHSKSVEKECVLWVETDQQYKQLLNFISELLNSPDDVESLYEEIFE